MKKVILLEDLNKLGKFGDVVFLKRGFIRNYLIPKKKVLIFNKKNLKLFESKKTVLEKNILENTKKLQNIYDICKNIKTIVFKKNTIDGKRIFGSISSVEIVKILKDQYNVENITSNMILMKKIKLIGNYNIKILFNTKKIDNISIKINVINKSI